MLSLGPDAVSQTRAIIDEDGKSAKELWDELEKIYTESSAQRIQNITQQLESLIFEDKEDWDEHVSRFLSICDELALYDKEVSDDDKV